MLAKHKKTKLHESDGGGGWARFELGMFTATQRKRLDRWALVYGGRLKRGRSAAQLVPFSSLHYILNYVPCVRS